MATTEGRINKEKVVAMAELEIAIINTLLPHMESGAAMHAAGVLAASGVVQLVPEDAGDIL